MHGSSSGTKVGKKRKG